MIEFDSLSRDAFERGLLGCVMLNPSIGPEVFGVVVKKHFTFERNWIIAKSICELAIKKPEWKWEDLWAYMKTVGLGRKFKKLLPYLATLSNYVTDVGEMKSSDWKVYFKKLTEE